MSHLDPASAKGLGGATRMLKSSDAATSKAIEHPFVGATLRGTISCDARCICAVGDVVWVAERSGSISIRSGRTGEAQQIVATKEKILGTCMLHVDDEVWVGTGDGRILVFNSVTYALVIELTNPEAQAQADVVQLAFDGIHVFAAMCACRAGQWIAKSKVFVRSYLRQAPVTALVIHNSVLYVGDGDGCLSAFDVKSGEVVTSLRDAKVEITSLACESTTNTLWCARADGALDVCTFQPSIVRIESLRDAAGRGKLTALMCVGGKVWASSFDRTIYVFHAASRKLIGTIKGEHPSFIFALGKVFTLETARVWSLSNGGKINMYDAEGFFSPLRGHTDVAEEVSACHNKIQQLRMQLAHTEALVSSERDKVAQRDIELIRLREEKQEQLMRIHALEHAVDVKEDTIAGNHAGRQKILDELQALAKTNGELTVQLNLVEKEKMTLRGDVARVQEELNRVRTQFADKASQFIAVEQDRAALANEKQRLLGQIQLKEKDIAAAQEEAKKARDALASRNADLTKKESDMMSVADRLALYKSERDTAADLAKRAEEAKKRLEDTILLKEVELKDVVAQLAAAQHKSAALEREVQDLQRQREEDVRARQRLHDSHVLRNHEYDNVVKERDALQQQLDFEKQQTHSARDGETKLRLQNEELRRKLETEQNSVKMLQDQYTIFQFVVNSRGELVSQLWTLYNKGVAALKTLQELESNIKATDPTTMDRLALKREWKSAVVDRTRNSCAAVADVQRLTEYVVCNYFSEYEKLHLGISTSKFPPDTQRPVVVGDQLLTKLRDVTLTKQYQTPTSSKIPQPLPPPYDVSFGEHHSILDVSSRATGAPVHVSGGGATPSAYYYGPTNVSNISAAH